jgi:hypothetical protein
MFGVLCSPFHPNHDDSQQQCLEHIDYITREICIVYLFIGRKKKLNQ